MNLPLLRRVPWHFVVVGLLVLLWIFLVRRALAPFFVAMVLAYLLSPLARRMERHISRGWATLLLLLGTLLALAALLVWLVPWAIQQVERLLRTLPALQSAVESRFLPWLAGYPWLDSQVRSAFAEFEPTTLLHSLQNAGAGILSFFLRLLSYLLVPVILYYLLVDGPAFIKGIDALIPPRHRAVAHGFIGAIHERLGGYIRGQIAVAAVMTLLQSLALMIQGVPYAWLLGLVAGCAVVVPYLPYATALPAALLVAVGTGFGGGKLAVLLLIFVAVQKIEGLYLTPVWVGKASRLHPLEVLLAVLTFGYALGLVGLVFAVPLMIVLKVTFEHLIAHYQVHPWFREGEPEEES
nr:AI-2E family transporter [uncultured Holophaga sp.]